MTRLTYPNCDFSPSNTEKYKIDLILYIAHLNIGSCIYYQHLIQSDYLLTIGATLQVNTPGKSFVI